jgi:hypothetical protein
MKFRLNTLIKKPSDKELLGLWRELAILKADNKCEYPFCNKKDYLNVHHIYSRSHKSVRYDPDNSIVLCPFHHSLGTDSAHKSPNFLRILVEHYVRSQDFLDKLERRAKSPAKLDLNLEKLSLQSKLKGLKKLKPYKTISQKT